MRGPGFLSKSLPNSTVLFSGFLLFAAYAGEVTGALSVLGPNKCTSCHDHDKQKQWADKDTHTKALEQLEDAEGKAKKYLAALGLSDPYNLKGPCVACHATVFNGDANAGVSCETCHGPGSAYLEPHQKKGSHKESVTLGLINTRESYTDWANLCVGCHVVTDRKLTAAGHSSGADFELAVKSKKLRESTPGVKHWEPAYEDSKLADAGKAAMRARTGGMAPPKPELKPPATAPPAATVTKPQPKATPTSAPAPVRPTVEERSPSRPSPAMTATKPLPKASPTPVPEVTARLTIEEKPTARPAATETAVALPTQRSTPVAPRTAAPGQSPAATSTPSIVIKIESTPIPTIAPRVREVPTAAPTALEPPPPQETPSPRPTRRPTHRKPRPKPTARPQPQNTPQPVQPAQPPPTPIPTRVRAPATMSVPH